MSADKLIYVNASACTGCGACVDACPEGAIGLNGVARIDQQKCKGCEACLAACPHDAIVVATDEPLPSPERESQVATGVPRVVVPQERPDWHSRLLPALGLVASFTAREVLPRLADYLASRQETRSPARVAGGTAVIRGSESSRSAQPRATGLRHRWRGGR